MGELNCEFIVLEGQREQDIEMEDCYSNQAEPVHDRFDVSPISDLNASTDIEYWERNQQKEGEG